MNLLKMLQTRRLLLMFFVFCMFGSIPSFAQDKKITLNETNTALVNILHKIEKQTKYLFVYGEDVNVSQKVDINVKNELLNEVLNSLFKNRQITYAIDQSNIVLSHRTLDQIQSGRVQGVIKDTSGEPLIGATIKIKDENSGTVTDFDGRFSLNLSKISSETTLVIDYIGYKQQQIRVGNQRNFTIVMQDASTALTEVVVTALGIKREEKALSYNVQQVKDDALVTNKDANFVNSLNGKVAGVTINSSSSGVGGASKVVMRGTKSIAQSSNALYVIDGIPMFNTGGSGDTEFGSNGSTEGIADINPEDIESISVLTGAAAAALYGSNASNGAIVITTKKGKAGKTSLNVSSSTEFLNALVTPKRQNRYGTGDLTSSTDVFDRSWGHKLDPQDRMDYTPQDDFFETGVVNMQNVSLSTGTELNQTYLSASQVASQGLVPNNKYNRVNFTFRNTTSFLNDKMKLDLGGSYIRQKDQNMVNQGIYSNPLVESYLFPSGDDWNDIKMYERYDSERRISTQYWPQGLDEYVGQNPYWIAYRNVRKNNKKRYMFNASLSYDVLDWLNLGGRVRVDNSNNEFTSENYASTNTTLTEGSENGLYDLVNTESQQTYADFLANINKRFADIYTVQANLGMSYSDIREDGSEIYGPIRADGIPNLFNVFQLDDSKTARSQSGWREQTKSIFASTEFGYKGAYYLTLTARNDWPSQLAGPNSSKKSFFYPSVGTSFVLSEIFTLPKEVEYAKVRASYASVGLPFPRFLANPTYAWDNKNKVWQTKSNYPMYNLKPERTDSYEFGLSLRFLKHFNLDATYYFTETTNQTFDPNISVSSGYSTLYVQTGSVENKGFELSLGYQNTWGDFSWDSNYTLSANKNKITELVDNYVHPETGTIINKERLDIGGLSQARFILKKGGGLGDLYSIADLQRDSEGNILVNEEGHVTALYNVDDIKLGSVFPKANMAWRNNFKYKNINLGFMVSARLGGIVYSATEAAMDRYGVSKASADARDAGGVVINGNNVIDAQNWYGTVAAESGLPQFYTYSATNVRLQEAHLGYTFGKDMLWGVGSLNISLVAKNLWMIYNKAPFDPESVASTGNYYQGIDNFMMPSTRSLGFNVRMKF